MHQELDNDRKFEYLPDTDYYDLIKPGNDYDFYRGMARAANENLDYDSEARWLYLAEEQLNDSDGPIPYEGYSTYDTGHYDAIDQCRTLKDLIETWDNYQPIDADKVTWVRSGDEYGYYQASAKYARLSDQNQRALEYERNAKLFEERNLNMGQGRSL